MSNSDFDLKAIDLVGEETEAGLHEMGPEEEIKALKSFSKESFVVNTEQKLSQIFALKEMQYKKIPEDVWKVEDLVTTENPSSVGLIAGSQIIEPYSNREGDRDPSTVRKEIAALVAFVRLF
uniref:Uncharacterized protein n=1 Tax=Cannabis sativa TaxID=3483 RepID=A0A803Q1Z1_CANSA